MNSRSIPLVTFIVLLFRQTLFCASFVAPAISKNRKDRNCRSNVCLSESNWDESLRELKRIQERQSHNELLDALFEYADSSTVTSLSSICVSGQARLPLARNSTRPADADLERIITLVLTSKEPQPASQQSTSAILVPLASQSQLKLVSFAAARRPLSKSVLLGLNTILVNRDGGLFDNLPWASWSVDPQRRNRDAAGNSVNSKYHLGKRDAYNRFMGKDWQGRSLAIGNLALRLKYQLEDSIPNSDDRDAFDEEGNSKELAIQVLRLQIKELRMDIADLESQLAIARNTAATTSDISTLEREREDAITRLENAIKDLESIEREAEVAVNIITDTLQRIADWTTSDGMNAAPYRGALGYAPMLDSKEDIKDSILPYTNPYDLLEEILADQLNAKVVGCVLENASLLRGNLALGGAIVLQRKVPTKKVSIGGEEIEYDDFEEDFGNEGLVAGEMMIVECDTDEAIGCALACQVPLKIESSILDQGMIQMERNVDEAKNAKHILDHLPLWRTIDAKVKLEVEGERSPSEKVSPISIPRTSSSLFEDIFSDKPEKSSLFPSDNPVRSLEQLDAMSNEDKAKCLLEMSSFSGKLPRPRVVRSSKSNPLDELLVPLIDESVRRQYFIRDAENRGDLARAAELRQEKSGRQMAKERANAARDDGRDTIADQWETEAEFLESLRADVTQDEGAYSRFLDRDYWYEKDRQATAKRVDRSKFGNLLDGIE